MDQQTASQTVPRRKVPRGAIVTVLVIGFLLILAAPAPVITTPDGTKVVMTPEAQRLAGITFLMAGLLDAVPMIGAAAGHVSTARYSVRQRRQRRLRQ